MLPGQSCAFTATEADRDPVVMSQMLIWSHTRIMKYKQHPSTLTPRHVYNKLQPTLTDKHQESFTNDYL